MRTAKTFIAFSWILFLIGFADVAVHAEREAGYLLILAFITGLIGIITYFGTSRVCSGCGMRVSKSHAVCRYCGRKDESRVAMEGVQR